jgi:hypothetical protein
MMSRVWNEVIDRPEFRAGLRWSAGLTALTAIAGLVSTRLFRRPAPVAGLIVALALVKGMKQWDGLPTNVTRGLVYLAVAGFSVGVLASLWRPLALTGMLFALPGASLLTSNTGLPDVRWVGPLVVVTVVVGGTLVADFDRRHHERGWSVVMFAVSVVGVYFTVPDTERALVLLGASVPILLLGWPFALATLGTAGSYPAVGALAWIAAVEGFGRRSSIVAAVACLGLFVVEPIARLLRLGSATIFDRLPRRTWAVLPVAAAHLALVFVASRVAGLRTAVGEAAVIAAVDLIVGVAVVLILGDDLIRGRDSARASDRASDRAGR